MLIGILLIVWGALLAALIAYGIGKGRAGGALTLAYFLGLSMIHVPGVLPYLADVSILSSTDFVDSAATDAGFTMTVIGMAAFVVGAILVPLIDRRRIGPSIGSSHPRSRAFERIGIRGLALGALAYFLLMPFSHSVASLTAVISPVATLLIIGFWLMLYGAADVGDRTRTWITLALLPLLPMATLITGGFLGYGIYWMLSIIAFQFVISRHRTRYYAAAPFVIYLGLSLFVAYMGQRTGIRELVWEKRAGLTDRIERVSRVITNFHPFDPTSLNDLEPLNDRLNQNELVGLAIARIDSGWAEFAYGATVPIWALIPRAIWPEKPFVGGGGDIVANYTGIHFFGDTSVGVGQVMEFYINFGVPAEIVGFLVLGFVLMWLDRGIMRALDRNDARGLLLRAMPGLTMLQPGGNLLEIIVGVAAAIIVAHLLTGVRAMRIVWAAPAASQPA